MTDSDPSPTLPCSPACERNREPIRVALAGFATPGERVLELGAGTGQHAVYLAAALALDWLPTDLPASLPAVRTWIAAARARTVRAPRALDVRTGPWPDDEPFDGVFSANTAHIVSWEGVEAMLTGVFRTLRPGGWFALYGPFNENGTFTSEGNRALDAWARETFPGGGLRDRADVIAAARDAGLAFEAARALPANNQLLVFRKPADTAAGKAP